MLTLMFMWIKSREHSLLFILRCTSDVLWMILQAVRLRHSFTYFFPGIYMAKKVTERDIWAKHKTFFRIDMNPLGGRPNRSDNIRNDAP